MMFTEMVYDTIRQYELFTSGDTVIVGLSGGADSVSLLHTLCTLKDDCHIRLVAVHINHRLRGEESQCDQRFCEELCNSLSVPLIVRTCDVKTLATAQGKGVEEMGREFRYEVFREIAAQFSPSVIATAHTADDAAETLLFHLCRGCGIKGAAGIPIKRNNIIRPLLKISRTDVERYCLENQLSFVTDSTNADMQYSRNRIRHQVLPAMRMAHNATDVSLQRFMRTMETVNSFLQQQTELLYDEVATEKHDVLYRKPLQEAHTLLRSLVLQRFAEEQGLCVDEKHLREMELVVKNGGMVSLQDDHLFGCTRHTVFLCSKQASVFCEEEYQIFVLSREEYEQKLNNSSFLFQKACDYDKINGSLRLRPRHEGDCFHPANRGCRKTLKKFFNEQEIPPMLRDGVPLLCDDDGIALVVGYACDERVKITDKTTRIVVVEKKRRK